jgi:hypothetical protein
MVSESNFIVRMSGRKADCWYIDYAGVYKAVEIAKVSGMEASVVKEIYINNGGSYDETQDVYYFPDIDKAKKAVSDILKKMKSDQKGRIISLTDAEIEYIRKALINEGSNTIHLKNSIKDAIFKKLNA